MMTLEASWKSNNNSNSEGNDKSDVLRTWRRLTLHPFQG